MCYEVDRLRGKPDQRKKDWDDFLFVLKNYGDITDEAIFSEFHLDLINDNFDFPVAAAHMLGRDMKTVIGDNSILKTKIINALIKEQKGFSNEEIKQFYAVNHPYDDLPKTLLMISETIKGLLD